MKLAVRLVPWESSVRKASVDPANYNRGAPQSEYLGTGINPCHSPVGDPRTLYHTMAPTSRPPDFPFNYYYYGYNTTREHCVDFECVLCFRVIFSRRAGIIFESAILSSLYDKIWDSNGSRR